VPAPKDHSLHTEERVLSNKPARPRSFVIGLSAIIDVDASACSHSRGTNPAPPGTRPIMNSN